jgi:hypothetical protein
LALSWLPAATFESFTTILKLKNQYLTVVKELRMLEFYYDFMDVFVDRSDFQYCAMDADSAYMALSATSLEEVIKPYNSDGRKGRRDSG